ncbi:MAG: hypothetical protein ABF946_04070 [Acetobacter papayae]
MQVLPEGNATTALSPKFRVVLAHLAAWLWKMCVGVRGGIRTHGPRIHPTTVFTAALSRVGQSVRGLDCPFAINLQAGR